MKDREKRLKNNTVSFSFSVSSGKIVRSLMYIQFESSKGRRERTEKIFKDG